MFASYSYQKTICKKKKGKNKCNVCGKKVILIYKNIFFHSWAFPPLLAALVALTS